VAIPKDIEIQQAQRRGRLSASGVDDDFRPRSAHSKTNRALASVMLMQPAEPGRPNTLRQYAPWIV
jgi:hypothetical protein